MKRAKMLHYLIVLVLTIFVSTIAQAGDYTPILNGNLNQLPGSNSSTTVEVTAPLDPNVSIILNNALYFNAQGFGDPLNGAVQINADWNMYMTESFITVQQGNGMPFTVSNNGTTFTSPTFIPLFLWADNDVIGNATVGGGWQNVNTFNTVYVTNTGQSAVNVHVEQELFGGYIQQGGVQAIVATAGSGSNYGDATVASAAQSFDNYYNYAVSVPTDGGGAANMGVMQAAGDFISTVLQGGVNVAFAFTGAGNAAINAGEIQKINGVDTIVGGQSVRNFMNTAGANGNLNLLDEDPVFDGGKGQLVQASNVLQSGINWAEANSLGPAPVGDEFDPAITAYQTVINSMNNAQLTSQTTQYNMKGAQTFEIGPNDNVPMFALNFMDSYMGSDGTSSAKGQQYAQYSINTVNIAKGGGSFGYNDGINPPQPFVQQTTSGSPINMTDENNTFAPDPDAWGCTNCVDVDLNGRGTASADVSQYVLAQLNVVSSSGPLAGDLSQTIGGTLTQQYNNKINVSSTLGNVDITGSQIVKLQANMVMLGQ